MAAPVATSNERDPHRPDRPEGATMRALALLLTLLATAPAAAQSSIRETMIQHCRQPVMDRVARVKASVERALTELRGLERTLRGNVGVMTTALDALGSLRAALRDVSGGLQTCRQFLQNNPQPADPH